MKADLENELRRAYDVLKHLKRKVGGNAFNEEYRVVMNDIKGALNVPKKPKASKPREEPDPTKDSTALNIELPKQQDPSDMIARILPFMGARDLLSVAALSSKTCDLVDGFVQQNNAHIKQVFRLDEEHTFNCIAAVSAVCRDAKNPAPLLKAGEDDKLATLEDFER